jgi:hypothetical protein
MMTSCLGNRTLHPADAKLFRLLLTYVLPGLAVFYVVLSGLWLVPDSLVGMYGNHDGHWASWGARGILTWGGFLDFSPLSPLTGTGSPFLPNLPWLNPGSLPLALPVPLALRHLVSMLVYLAELSASLYLLYRHLEFSREQSFLATILYICIFFIPINGYAEPLTFYSLAPVNAHLIAAMNVATIALIRVGHERIGLKLVYGFVFVAALFIAFASAPITSLTYVPVYGVLWLAFLIPFQAQRPIVLWRWGTIAFALLLLGVIGVPRYLAAMAMTAARGGTLPPMFHAGWLLLTLEFWWDAVSAFSKAVCQNWYQLMCPFTIIGWFEMATLAGAVFLAFVCSGAKRMYGLAIISLLALLHFYALLSTRLILGRLHLVSMPYLMWAFFPLAAPAAVAAGNMIATLLFGRRVSRLAWMPAVASCVIAVAAIVVWVRFIKPNVPRVPGPGMLLGLAPIAHIPASRGPIPDYLQQYIGLRPGSEFRGYATTFLGAPDGIVRKLTSTPNERMSYDAYVAARDILSTHFGNSFQMMDLWNNGIPTLEEYGQSVSKQMYYFNRDLLAQPQDQVDPLQTSILLYRFHSPLLRALGVRFVIADGSLAEPSIELVMTQLGKAGVTMNLYEINAVNLGQFSPTQVTWAADYSTAVRTIRERDDLENRVVLLGASEQRLELVSASRSRLFALGDGYRLSASAPGTAMVVLPVQFSHCWQIENMANTDPPRILRANIIQTGVLFKNKVDVRLRFDFEPWKATCRLLDAGDLTLFGFK